MGGSGLGLPRAAKTSCLMLAEEVPRKAVVDDQSIRTKTDTGRSGEKPQALERTVVKELGKMTPYVRNKGALLATEGAEKRLWRLFIKNTALC